MLLKIAKISYAAVALSIVLWAVELWLLDLPWYVGSALFWMCSIPLFWYLYTGIVLGPILLITSALILNQRR